MIRFNDILEKVADDFSEKDVHILQKAYVFAAQAHKGQVRRSGVPYLSHPLEVAGMLADMKLDAVTLAAGLLHDVLEDTEVTQPELQENFGPEISHLVEGVTKISLVQESSPETRHAETIRKIILAMTDDLRVIFIKLADRIHNLKTLKFLGETKQKRIARETLDLYAPIANRLGMGRIKAELEDLSFRYVNPGSFFRIAALVDPLRKNAEKDLSQIRESLESLMRDNGVPVELHSRIKRPYSIFNKMNKRDIPFDQVYDFMAMRLITDSVKNCYSALGILHQKWPHLPSRFRDFIAIPKPNLYQSLHTTIITDKKRTIEIQIRTHDMHAMAENGIAAHWRYKEPFSQSSMKDDRRLQWLRELVDLYQEQKDPREFLKNLKTNLIPEEVYVFTPQGKVITLPMGATALDFAFKIHSEIGLHAAEAVIDGKASNLKTVLQPGSIVEIVTSKQNTPSREWLNTAFTSTARHHIKRWLNLREKTKNISVGKKLWMRESARYRIPSSELKPESLIERLSRATPLRIRRMEDFYALVGVGKVFLDRKLMEKLFPEQELADRRGTRLQKVVSRVVKRDLSPILVKDVQDTRIHMARCCSPIKGEPIIGYITTGKGITVHSRRCARVQKEILPSERMVEVSWGAAPGGPYRGILQIETEDSPGVLARLTAIIARQEGNISRATVRTGGEGRSQIKLTLAIKDIDHLDGIIKRISSIKEVRSVKRV